MNNSKKAIKKALKKNAKRNKEIFGAKKKMKEETHCDCRECNNKAKTIPCNCGHNICPRCIEHQAEKYNCPICGEDSGI